MSKQDEEYLMVNPNPISKDDYLKHLNAGESMLFQFVLRTMKWGGCVNANPKSISRISRYSIISVNRTLAKCRKLGFIISWRRGSKTNYINPNIAKKGDKKAMGPCWKCYYAQNSLKKKKKSKRTKIAA